MPRPKVSEIDQIVIAYLFAEHKLKQKDIAARLNLGESTVSHILKEKQGELLVKNFHFKFEAVDTETMEKVWRRLAHDTVPGKLDEITRKFGRPGPVFRVFESEPVRGRPNQLVKFGTQAAKYVRGLLMNSKLCGITSGRVIANVMRSVSDVGPWPRGQRPPIFVPLVGQARGGEPVKTTASVIVNEIDRTLNGDEHPSKSLAMIPALFPKDPREAKLVRKCIEPYSPDYSEIFTKPSETEGRPLADQLDCIMTSANDVPLGSSFQKHSSFLPATEWNNRWNDYFVGDIGGVLLLKSDKKADPEAKAIKKDIERRWTGIRAAHFEACARRTGSHESPGAGVVLICSGEKRAKVVKAAVEQGWINHLVVDPALEMALAHELGIGRF
jgi:DNA-binding transcriptional regulator LsrR (DeoR family)